MTLSDLHYTYHEISGKIADSKAEGLSTAHTARRRWRKQLAILAKRIKGMGAIS